MNKNNFRLVWRLTAILLTCAVAFSGCGGGDPAATTSHPPSVTTNPTTSAPTTAPTTAATTTPTTTPAPTTTPPPSINAAALYASSCAACHGANRQGVVSGTTVLGPAIPPTLNFIVNRTEAQLAMFLSGHATSINMTNAERAALATFLKNP
jgi:mono/diheme cytochrome c family protein